VIFCWRMWNCFSILWPFHKCEEEWKVVLGQGLFRNVVEGNKIPGSSLCYAYVCSCGCGSHRKRYMHTVSVYAWALMRKGSLLWQVCSCENKNNEKAVWGIDWQVHRSEIYMRMKKRC
jgi:hypothetical protein